MNGPSARAGGKEQQEDAAKPSRAATKAERAKREEL
jgi:hypothetical protein